MTLWIVPLAIAALAGILALASQLEGRRVRLTVRMTVRSRTATPELAEALVAAELAPLLAAHGIDRRSMLRGG